MAKGNKQIINIPNEDIEDRQMQGAQNCAQFLKDLNYKVTFGVLSKPEANKELKRVLSLANSSRDKYKDRIEKWKRKENDKFSPHDILDLHYWQSFAHGLHMVVTRKAEVIERKLLSDFFTDAKMSFRDFQNLMEKAQMSKDGKMKKDGISYKALATYNIFVDEKYISKTTKEKVFRDCFTQYFCNATLGDSAYANARQDPKGHIAEHSNNILKALGKM